MTEEEEGLELLKREAYFVVPPSSISTKTDKKIASSLLYCCGPTNYIFIKEYIIFNTIIVLNDRVYSLRKLLHIRYVWFPAD